MRGGTKGGCWNVALSVRAQFPGNGGRFRTIVWCGPKKGPRMMHGPCHGRWVGGRALAGSASLSGGQLSAGVRDALQGSDKFLFAGGVGNAEIG